MTACMWLILLATLGLAAVVTHWPALSVAATGAGGVALGERVTVGDVTVQLPAGWDVTDQSIVLVRSRVSASEPGGSDGRTLIVSVEGGEDRFIDEVVVEELSRRGVGTARYSSNPFRIGPLDGVMLGGARAGGPRGRDGGGALASAARLPGRDRIVRIDLLSKRLSRADVQLLRRVAATVEIRPPAPVERFDPPSTAPTDPGAPTLGNQESPR